MKEPNLLLLQNNVLRVASLLSALGFRYGEQSEEVYLGNWLGDREIQGDWIIEQYPGILVQHIESGHYWISPNDITSVEQVKHILKAVGS